MGIKGIYKEIGPGTRISLTKLAVEKLERTGQPLRLAIDISIWQFQAQAARGGSNPAIRTLFYRLLRLLSLSIQPIFVFDGPNKPTFKRNKRAGRGDGIASAMAKRLIRLFGCMVHDAPGEAEAECALLQQHGIVDAVLSEDVDTIMFGCTQTLRNWSAEGKGKTPTHVSLYKTEELRQSESGLDREGMVLVAMISGGDYLPEGIPGAGVKLACEAARAGFGKSLCQLKRSDTVGLAQWKEKLTHELRTNENKFFRTKHMALTIPQNFPNLEVLRYYTHPVVSPLSTIDRLKSQEWQRPIDIQELREFVRETFDWSYRGGAIKFIRVLAPCLLIRKIMDLSDRQESQSGDIDSLEEAESSLVKSIRSRRVHFSTDATPELRLSFIPTDIVGYNFEEEPEEVIEYGRDGLALNSDDEDDAVTEEEESEATPKKVFNPTEPDLSWVPETIAKFGIPLMVEDWEATQRAKAYRLKTKGVRWQKQRLGGMAAGALNQYVKVTKNLPPLAEKASVPSNVSQAPLLPPAKSQSSLLSVSQKASHSTRPSKPSKSKKTQMSRLDSSTNPWTIAGSQSTARAADKSKTSFAEQQGTETITISSSPPASPPSITRQPVRRTRSPTPKDENDGNWERSPHKRPSTAQSQSGQTEQLDPDKPVKGPSPTPGGKGPRRKLARTESMPATSPRACDISHGSPRTNRTGLIRARTVAVEAERSDVDSDFDPEDLPPMSSFLGRLPKPKQPTLPHTSPPVTKSTTAISSLKKQSKLGGDAFGMRTTRMYVPRESLPGFFKEVDVSIKEAERLERKGGQWRRSDVSVIDLTGEELD